MKASDERRMSSCCGREGGGLSSGREGLGGDGSEEDVADEKRVG